MFVSISQKRAWQPLNYFTQMKSKYFREYLCSFSSKSYYFYILGVSHLNKRPCLGIFDSAWGYNNVSAEIQSPSGSLMVPRDLLCTGSQKVMPMYLVTDAAFCVQMLVIAVIIISIIKQPWVLWKYYSFHGHKRCFYWQYFPRNYTRYRTFPIHTLALKLTFSHFYIYEHIICNIPSLIFTIYTNKDCVCGFVAIIWKWSKR